jgi:hypothetical protein
MRTETFYHKTGKGIGSISEEAVAFLSSFSSIATAERAFKKNVD